MKRISPVLIMLLLLGSCFPINFTSASGESTTISTFVGGYASVDVELQGGVTNNSTTIEIPRNVTFSTASFDLEVDHTQTSPGQVWIDLNQDGIFEWEFTETGYGDIGRQNQFFDGSEWIVTGMNSGAGDVPGILLPTAANLQSSNLNVSFTTQVGGGFFALGEYQEVVESDLDGDGLPEPVFLSAIDSTNYSTTISWIDWSPTNGLTTSSPVQSCDNATSLSVGDLNGDGDEDIVSFSSISSSACIHISNGTSFDPAINISYSGLLGGKLGDLNNDSSDDIITIHSMGILSYSTWDNSSWGLNPSVNQTINPNGSVGIPANLASIHVDDFFGNGNDSVLVMDSMGHWTNWNIFSGYWGGPLTTFDSINRDEILSDLDGDGDIDLIGSNDLGYAIQINNGTQWNTTVVQSQIELLNATIVDFDNDGVLDLLSPVPGFSDGSSATLEGNITYRSINASTVGNLAMTELEPWTMPTSVSAMDLDNDGLAEQIVAAGESTKGVFIGSWHSIEFDANGDGTLEMSMAGYAGDSSNGLGPLMMSDEIEAIRDDLAPILATLPSTTDAYGIGMSNYSMSFSSIGMGQFNFSNLELGYNCNFHVDINPHVTNNITNVINQGMTAGVGTYTLSIPVNSTQNGIVSLSNILATHVPGAPNLALPDDPVLILDSASPEQITLSWNDSSYLESGDLIEFEIFRLESASASVSLIDVYNSTINNFTIDTDVVIGSTYWYSIRSVHSFGVTSNLSNTIEVKVPYPASPVAINGIILEDVGNDNGGVLAVSWNHSLESIDHYEIYLESNSFSSISGLTPVTNVNSSLNTTHLTGLVNAQEYWVAVVAVDQFGNSTTAVTSVGPSYPRNDTIISVELQLDVTSEISLGSPFSLEISALVDGVSSIPNGSIVVSMVTSSQTYPIMTNWDGINLTDFAELGVFTEDIYGEVTFMANYSGFVGDAQNRDISNSSVSESSHVSIGAVLSASESAYELDWDNETDVRVNLAAINLQQASMLEGATISWSITNDSSNNSLNGTNQISNGFSQFLVNFPGGGTLFVNVTDPLWIDTGSSPLQINLVPYGTDIEENETEENETNQTTWSPDTMGDVTVDCGNIEINQDNIQLIECTITNPNNYSITVSLEPEGGWSEWSNFITFAPSAGQDEIIIEEFANYNLNIEATVLKSLPTTGKIEIDLRQSPSDYNSINSRPLRFEIDWTLVVDDAETDPDPEEEDNNSTTSNSEESSSGNSMMIIGGIGAVALIGLVAFIVLRIRNSDIEDWDEDDLDFDPVVISDTVSRPLPVGLALDEIQDKTIDDEIPDKPDFIADFDNDEVQPEYNQEEYEEEFEDEHEGEHEEEVVQESEDSGITVDEDGTEWYEDEVGVWWFRDPGQDDWSEYAE